MKRIILLLILIFLVQINFAQSPLLILMNGAENIIAPVAPTIAAVGGGYKITVSNAQASIGDSLRIYRGTSTNPTTWVHSMLPNTAWVDSPKTGDVIYFYRAKTLKNGILSAYSSNVNDTALLYQSSVTIPNFSFETITGTQDDATTDAFTGWVTNYIGTGLIESVTDAYDGTSAVKMTTGDNVDIRMYENADNIPLDANSSYTLSAWEKRVGGDGNVYGLYYWKTTTGYGGQTDTDAETGTSWTQVKRDFTTGAGAGQVIEIYIKGFANSGILFIDKMELKKKY